MIAVLLRIHVFKSIFESLVCSAKREDSLEVTPLGSGVVEGMFPSFCVKEAAHGIARVTGLGRDQEREFL